MTDLVPLARLKAHLSLTPGDTLHDDYLAGLLASAVRTVELETGYHISGGAESLGKRDLPVAAQAVLLLAATWFTNRESVVVGGTPAKLPHGVEMLLNLIRVPVI